jgi:hypothetical protein
MRAQDFFCGNTVHRSCIAHRPFARGAEKAIATPSGLCSVTQPFFSDSLGPSTAKRFHGCYQQQ